MKNPLTPIEAALPQILSRLPVCADAHTVALEVSVGHVLTEDLVARVDVPGADSSAMDGYAVRVQDIPGVPARLPVTQRIPAGLTGSSLAAGTAARIFTGAALPPGADAVVIQEHTRAVTDGVEILQLPVVGENIRRAGGDVKRGQLLFRRGHRIRVQDISLLAATGYPALTVVRPLKVAVLATGNELVRPGEPLGPGQAYNSNFYAISSLLQRLGMQVVDIGIVADDLALSKKAIAEAAASADCIIASGGVSEGEEDHVKAAVQALGNLFLWKLAIKPGKPFAFGSVAGKPFFGLPGNPVSAFVTFVLLVRPALLTMSGSRNTEVAGLLMPAGFSLPMSGERQEYLRVSIGNGNSGGQSLIQSSGVSSSLSMADGLAVVAPYTAVAPGDMLRYLPFSELVD